MKIVKEKINLNQTLSAPSIYVEGFKVLKNVEYFTLASYLYLVYFQKVTEVELNKKKEQKREKTNFHHLE